MLAASSGNISEGAQSTSDFDLCYVATAILVLRATVILVLRATVIGAMIDVWLSVVARIFVR